MYDIVVKTFTLAIS